jgi:hypothetical protein
MEIFPKTTSKYEENIKKHFLNRANFSEKKLYN